MFKHFQMIIKLLFYGSVQKEDFDPGTESDPEIPLKSYPDPGFPSRWDPDQN